MDDQKDEKEVEMKIDVEALAPQLGSDIKGNLIINIIKILLIFTTLSWYLILIPITWYSNYLGLKKWCLRIFHHQGKRRPSTKAGFLSSIVNYAAQLLLAAVVTVSGHWVFFIMIFWCPKKDTPSTYMRSKIQVVSENVVEDYWEQVKARHIHNYVAYNNTRSATNSTTNATKLTSRPSRRPRHPVISPFRMPPRGWPRYDTLYQSYSLCHSLNGENKEGQCQMMCKITLHKLK